MWTTAAAAALHAIDPHAIDHCLFSHLSVEPGHRRVLERLGAKPLLDLGLRLGEGTGAALAAGIVKSAVRIHAGMATFASAASQSARCIEGFEAENGAGFPRRCAGNRRAALTSAA